MKNIIIKTWNGQDLDLHNSADITDLCVNTFKEIAHRHMHDMDATSMHREEDEYYSFTCTDDVGGEDHGALFYVPYNGEYGVRIYTNINEFEFVTEEEWAAALDEYEEKEYINDTNFMADDGSFYVIFIKL